MQLMRLTVQLTVELFLGTNCLPSVRYALDDFESSRTRTRVTDDGYWSLIEKLSTVVLSQEESTLDWSCLMKPPLGVFLCKPDRRGGQKTVASSLPAHEEATYFSTLVTIVNANRRMTQIASNSCSTPS